MVSLRDSDVNGKQRGRLGSPLPPPINSIESGSNRLPERKESRSNSSIDDFHFRDFNRHVPRSGLSVQAIFENCEAKNFFKIYYKVVAFFFFYFLLQF